MATFTKLFAISMVASKRFGRSRSHNISLAEFVWDSLSSLKCCGVSEKKAVSEPDIMAEKNSNTSMLSKDIRIVIENG
jgi:hypothetical protein